MNVTMAEILYAVLTVALPLVLRFIYQIVSLEVADSRYAKAIDSIYSAVEHTNQTFVDALKEAGSFDEEAQLAAFEKAKNAALECMEAGVRRWLERSFTDLDSWLQVQIEVAVRGGKDA